MKRKKKKISWFLELDVLPGELEISPENVAIFKKRLEYFSTTIVQCIWIRVTA
jgi:hypothetical protein